MSIDSINNEGLHAIMEAAEAALEQAPCAPWYVADQPRSGLAEELGYASISSPEHGCFIEVPFEYAPDSADAEGEKIAFAPMLLHYLSLVDPGSILELTEQLQAHRERDKKVKRLVAEITDSLTDYNAGRTSVTLENLKVLATMLAYSGEDPVRPA